MHDFLHLPHLRTLAAHDEGDHYRVEAEGTLIPTASRACGHVGLHRHGSQRQTYMDTPSHGKRALIEIKRKRYRCKACGKTLFDPLYAMDAKHMATTRLIQYGEKHCLRKTFVDISREVGVDDKTIRHIFDDHVAQMQQTVHFETPEILGIDELKIIGQYRAMITNVEKLTLFDMLLTRNKADLIAYFRNLPDKDKVKVLTMDLWSVYHQVAQEQFPGRIVVADRFHVIRMANDSIERLRKAIRKGLDTKTRLKLKDDRFILLSRRHNLTESHLEKLEQWTALFPALGAAYEAKEAFHNIYQHPTKEDAMKAAEDWEASIDPTVDHAFREVKVALRSWWTEIFNFYDYPISNAYTESINNIAMVMNRMGRGYSLEVIRARLLYDEKARAAGSQTVRKKVCKLGSSWGLMSDSLTTPVTNESAEEEQTVEYGAHLSTLAKLLEDGQFA